MSEACDRCPCPDICLRWEVFCRDLAGGDEAQRRHICARSAMGAGGQVVARNAPGPAPGAPTPAEVLALTAAMRRCPFRSRNASCGCAGGRCALRHGAIVSHLDCFDCLQKYPE